MSFTATSSLRTSCFPQMESRSFSISTSPATIRALIRQITSPTRGERSRTWPPNVSAALTANAAFSDCNGPVWTRGPVVADLSGTVRRGEHKTDLMAHRADIYSLGIVILEAITGQMPKEAFPSMSIAPDSRKNTLRLTLSPYVEARSLSAQRLIQAAEAAGGHKIPTGLRVILDAHSGSQPRRAYARGRELAEDLDRWRTNRPLTFAIAPFWGYTVPSSLKRWRRTLFAIAAALSLVVGLPTTALVMLISWRNLENLAQHRLERQWDQAEAYRFRRSSLHWLEDPRQGVASFQPTEPNESSVLEAAARALKYYCVFEPGDWRRRDEVRFLPQSDREELELWLLEQAFRYCLALSERPDSRDDWARARSLLEHLGTVTELPVFTVLRERLDRNLGITTANPTSTDESPVRSVQDGRSTCSLSLAVAKRIPDGRGCGVRFRRITWEPDASYRQPTRTHNESQPQPIE